MLAFEFYKWWFCFEEMLYFIGNLQADQALLQNKIIIYIIHILNIIEDSFKKLHIKSLRFASTKRIWKAIFIEEIRRNVLRLCENFGFLRWKSTYKVYFLGRNAHSWFFTKFFSSRFFRAELRPFGAHRIRSLIGNFAWFGSIQGLEINAQIRYLWVHLHSCGEPQTEGSLVPVGEETGGVSCHHTPDGLAQRARVGGYIYMPWSRHISFFNGDRAPVYVALLDTKPLGTTAIRRWALTFASRLCSGMKPLKVCVFVFICRPRSECEHSHSDRGRALGSNH